IFFSVDSWIRTRVSDLSTPHLSPLLARGGEETILDSRFTLLIHHSPSSSCPRSSRPMVWASLCAPRSLLPVRRSGGVAVASYNLLSSIFQVLTTAYRSRPCPSLSSHSHRFRSR